MRKQYGQAQLKKIQDQKIEVPRYPSLQEFDFQTECYDTMAIYYELLEELKQEKNLGKEWNRRRMWGWTDCHFEKEVEKMC